MSKREGKSRVQWAFVAKVRELAESLPSESDIRETSESIEKIVTYLSNVKETLQLFPSDKERDSVSIALARIDNMIERASGDELLKKVLEPKSRSLAKGKIAMPSEDDVKDAEEQLKALHGMPREQLRKTLEQSDMKSLRAIAMAAHVKVTSKITRKQMTEQIMMKVSNLRGYELLGIKSNQ